MGNCCGTTHCCDTHCCDTTHCCEKIYYLQSVRKESTHYTFFLRTKSGRDVWKLNVPLSDYNENLFYFCSLMQLQGSNYTNAYDRIGGKTLRSSLKSRKNN